MKTSEFKTQLQRHPESELCFMLPDGGRIPAHAHITEAGRVDKTFVDCGGTILACFDPKADGDHYPAVPNPDHLYFAVEDLEAAYAACRQNGAKLSLEDIHGALGGEIAVRPWGERSFYCRDPFGNKLCFVDQRTIFTGPTGV